MSYINFNAKLYKSNKELKILFKENTYKGNNMIYYYIYHDMMIYYNKLLLTMNH